MPSTTKGFSLIELLIVIAIILIIAAIAVPNLMKAKQTANESSAVGTLRSVATAQISYKISHDTYANDLMTLGPDHAGLLADRAVSDAPHQHSGYTFSTTGTAAIFNAGADPIDSISGTRSFCTDTPAAIYFSPTVGSCDPTTSSTI